MDNADASECIVPTQSNQADVRTLGYIGKPPLSHSRDSDSWFTPPDHIERVRAVLGGVIDLDPFSSKDANETVKATRYFDINNSAFERSWNDDGKPISCFMNPPYGRGLILPAVKCFIDNLSSVKQAVVLVNNATETVFFQALLEHANYICLPKRRISFENVDGKKISGNTRGQVYLHFQGDKPAQARFVSMFSEIGSVLHTTTPP